VQCHVVLYRLDIEPEAWKDTQTNINCISDMINAGQSMGVSLGKKTKKTFDK
jgi:hypothetical protein